MIIGAVKEKKKFENRVSISPDDVKNYVKAGHQVFIEKGAGSLSGFNDNIVIGVVVHELSVIVVIFNGARLAGNLGLWNLLIELFKNLYVDTIASFKQLFQNLFLVKESSTP